MYEIQMQNEVEHDYQILGDHERNELSYFIKKLQMNPHSVAVAYTRELYTMYKIKFGYKQRYRIVLKIDDVQRVVLIIAIGLRKTVYYRAYERMSWGDFMMCKLSKTKDAVRHLSDIKHREETYER